MIYTDFYAYSVFIKMIILWRTFKVYLVGHDAEVRPYIRVCYSEYDIYFSWTIYIMEGVLMGFGAFLAWETRQVSIN